MLSPRLTLDGKYTVFGRVVSGMAFVDAIERGEPPANPSRIVQASIAADNIPPPVPGQAVPGPVASLLPAPAVQTVETLPTFPATPAASPAPEAAPAAAPEPAEPAQPEVEAPAQPAADSAPEAQPEAATPQ
jgi:peptidylprolyl isomerase